MHAPTQKQEAPTSTSEGRAGPSAVSRGSSLISRRPRDTADEERYGAVRIEREGGGAHPRLTFEGPHDSLTGGDVEDLRDAVTALVESDARAITLRGRDGAFCSGADLSEFAGDERDAVRLRRLAATLYDAVYGLHTAPVPVVTGVNGVAAGAGFGLALAGDLVTMRGDARLEFAYPRIGLVGDAGATWLLPRLVGLGHAREIILRDEPIGADHAVGLGLATTAVPVGEFDERLSDPAAELAAGPTVALGRAKRLLIRSFERDLAEGLAAETEAMAAAARTADFKRGHAAFLDDDEPAFEGE